jgi:hypothetical protein
MGVGVIDTIHLGGLQHLRWPQFPRREAPRRYRWKKTDCPCPRRKQRSAPFPNGEWLDGEYRVPPPSPLPWRTDPRGGARFFQGVLKRQRIDQGGQHPHLVRDHAIELFALSRARRAKCSPLPPPRQFDDGPARAELISWAIWNNASTSMPAPTGFPQQGFAGQFQDNAPNARGHGLLFFAHLETNKSAGDERGPHFFRHQVHHLSHLQCFGAFNGFDEILFHKAKLPVILLNLALGDLVPDLFGFVFPSCLFFGDGRLLLDDIRRNILFPNNRGLTAATCIARSRARALASSFPRAAAPSPATPNSKRTPTLPKFPDGWM